MDEGAILILRDLGDIEDPVKMIQPSEQFALLGADHLSPSESSFCQLLISPDRASIKDLPVIVESVREKLDSALRATDLVSVFSHSLVSISLPYTDINEGEQIACSLLEQLSGFTFAGEAMTFSAGLAYGTGGDQEPIELFRRATSALDTARRSGGNRLWIDGGDTGVGPREIQGGNDYRHVVLLWNVMNALARATDLESMCSEFCHHLFNVFRADRAALLIQEGDRLNLAVGYIGDRGKTSHISDLQLSEREFAAIRSVSRGELREQLLNNTITLKIADKWVLLLSGKGLADDDSAFLETLCTYFASSIGRFEVVTEPETESAVPERKLILQSPEMRHVLETADLAAPTDATVLLSGESGTGKELVSRYIHERGNRADKPMVVVDCGAVAPSLIESELFGHVKGAFTGATSNFKGRLREADGGTVLLDEIGELPLETQVKLLRFVQDRQVAAVGTNQYDIVDARVIAATNKDLKEMVDAGDFREDLFYRLNVFSILLPPLRDRTADILPIARHYLEVFAKRYNKRITGFSPEAEQALLGHDWPGNVRELSNVVNRAVILSKDTSVTPIQLGVFSEAEVADTPTVASRTSGNLLSKIVDMAVDLDQPIPVGRFLEEDFILMSINRHDGVLNRAALSIGVPESTLRRKIQKIEQAYGSTDPDRPANWPVNHELYEQIINTAASEQVVPLDVLSSMLFNEIEGRKLNKTISAQLLGVSLPTYRRMAT
jgi:transcriptional regulator with GAF, ATPase, and Fis domain